MTGSGKRDDATAVVGAVSVAHFLSHVYLLAFPPLFPVLGRAFGLSSTRLGLLVTAIYVPTLLLQIPVGVVVDRVGARRALVVGLAVTALGVALAGLAPSYPALLACTFLSGVGQSAFHPANYALLDAVTDPSTEGTAFSVHTFGGYAGFAAAPVVVGGLALSVGWEVALVAVGTVGVAYALVVHVTTAPVYARAIRAENAADGDGGGEDTPDESLRDVLRDLLRFARRGDMLLVCGFYLLSMMAVVGIQSFTTVLAVDTFGFDESTANTLLTAHLAAVALGVVLGGPLADRLPIREVIAGLFLLAAAGVWLLVASTPGVVAAGAALTVVGLLVGLALPSRDKFANAVADPGAVGRSFGFYFTGLSLGAVVSPALLGWVIDAASPVAAFGLVAGFLVAAVGVVLVARVVDVGRPGTAPQLADD